MRRLIFVLFGGLAISVLNCAGVWAQSTAQISGTVMDQTRAVLPGVEISATQTDTGITRNAITNETGSYELPNLPIGPYRLEVTLPGFRTFVQSGIILQVNSNPVINAVLEIGQIIEGCAVKDGRVVRDSRP